MKAASEPFLKRLHRRLRDRPEAMQALSDQFGVSAEIVDRYRIGLSEPYPKPTSASPEPSHQDAVVAPVRDRSGRFAKRYFYSVLPGITVDNRFPRGESAWSTGPAVTYYSRAPSDGDSLLVCGDVRDLWALVGLIARSPLERQLVLVAPTSGTTGKWPQEWTTSEFWSNWKNIYIATPIKESRGADGHIEVDGRAHDLARLTRREVQRVPPPEAAGWSASCVAGLAADSLRKLLANAANLDPAALRADESAKYESAKLVDLTCAYHGGHLYETVRVLDRGEPSGGRVERYINLVVRSDRSTHRVEVMPYPNGTRKQDRVLRLKPADIQLLREPIASPYGTWRWQSVEAYLYRGTQSLPLVDLLNRLVDHLRASVWLPRADDYYLLACTAAASFCQQMFEAVPLIFVNGPAGSGKTSLGVALSDVSANSPGPVQASGATIPRLADWARGLLFIDDLEKLADRKRGGDPNASEIVQVLKLSYKKATAHKFWTNTDAGMKVDCLDFFGIKVINNTGGVDEILGSRMLTVFTRCRPKNALLPREGLLDPEQCAELRDHLHTWAFTHVSDIARAYVQIFPNPTTRADEIAAPLRVIAHLSGSALIQQGLERALNGTNLPTSSSPHELMEEAIQCILIKFIQDERLLRTTLTVQEVLMRLRLLGGPKFGKTSTTDVSEVESPEWVGRQFRQVFAPPGATVQRTTMYEAGIRFWPIDAEVLSRAVAASGVERSALTEEPNPRVFCRSCLTCDYSGTCSMEERKMASASSSSRESQRGRQRSHPGHASACIDGLVRVT